MATKSKTNINQEDSSIQTAGDAQSILGKGATLQSTQSEAGQGSVLIGAPNTTLGDVIFNQFPQAVAETVSSLIKSVDTSARQVGQQSNKLGEIISQQQLGSESNLPKVVLYVMVGGGLIYLASRILGR